MQRSRICGAQPAKFALSPVSLLHSFLLFCSLVLLPQLVGDSILYFLPSCGGTMIPSDLHNPLLSALREIGISANNAAQRGSLSERYRVSSRLCSSTGINHHTQFCRSHQHRNKELICRSPSPWRIQVDCHGVSFGYSHGGVRLHEFLNFLTGALLLVVERKPL